MIPPSSPSASPPSSSPPFTSTQPSGSSTELLVSKGSSPLPPEALLALLPSILSQVQADQMAARRFLRLELYLLGAMADKVLGEEELNRLMAAAGGRKSGVEGK